MTALVTFSPAQLKLIRNTIAKDASPAEFDLYMEMCRARDLNPLVRHAYCFVFHKDNPSKRQMVVVVSIDGQRHLAEKTGNYKPDDKAPRIVDGGMVDATNPKGIISAEVCVYKYLHGEWHAVPAVAYWDERAPIKEIWTNGHATGKFHLDPKKDGWHRMPRLMLAKVAEMDALRKAFPDSFSGLYGEAEMDRGEAIDLSPSEWAEKAEQEDRIAKIGGANVFLLDWMDGQPLDAVPAGQVHDKVMAFIEANREEPFAVKAFQDRNRHSLLAFWAAHKSDALALKKEFEKIAAALVIEAAE